MRTDHLVAHGFSAALIDNWKRCYTDNLLPLQARAVAETALLRGANLAVFAPTSSGKTFIAELAAVRQAQRGRKAVFLVPTKALAEEQYAHLCRVYSPVGLKVVVATRERTRHDAAILAGRFDLAVMVYEKLKAFATVAPKLLAQLGTVVVDELQALGDPDRGDVIDILLTRIVSAARDVQLVCLSAVLEENARLGSWLHSEFLVWKERPVELREGVFCIADGTFRYREQNGRAEGCEQIVDLPRQGFGAIAADPENHQYAGVAALTAALVMRGEQVLIFVPTRHVSRQWAHLLAQALGLESARDAAAALETHEESHARTLLERCFGAGVAFHNADLTHELRRLVEGEFNAGSLRVLVATSTLAQGVNLSCANVISVPTMLAGSDGNGAPAFCPLSVMRFRNQGGRAGRFRSTPADHSPEPGRYFGRSILVAENESETERLMQGYVFGSVEPLEPPAGEHALDRTVLDLVHCRLGQSHGRLFELLLSTYAGMTRWGARPQVLEQRIQESLARLESAHLVTERNDGRLVSTGIGQAAAAHGIKVTTAVDMEEFCRFLAQHPHAATPEYSEWLVLALCALSDDGADFPLHLTRTEAATAAYARRLSGRDDIMTTPMPESLRLRLAPEGGFPESDHAALKKAFLTESWISARTTAEIEEEFGILAGAVANLGAHLGWLTQTLAAFATALGVERKFCRWLAGLANRLPDGICAAGAAVAALDVCGLNRSHVAALVREGFDSPAAIVDATLETLGRVIPRTVAARLHAEAVAEREDPEGRRAGVLGLFAQGGRKGPKGQTGCQGQQAQEKIGRRRAYEREERPVPVCAEPAMQRPDLGDGRASTPSTVDLALDSASPGQVSYRGRTFYLSGTPFQLLQVLARNPGRVVSYRDLADAVWPDTQVEQQQILAHKRTIERGLAHVAEPDEIRRILRTICRQGLILDLPPERVHVGRLP